MCSRTLVLDARNQTLFECGATLLAILAYPSASDPELADIVASICSNHLRAVFEQSGNPDEMVKAKYAFRDQQAVRKDFKRIDRLIRDRLAAAHAAIVLLKNAIGHQLPADVKRPSLNEVSAFSMRFANQSDPENFETRVLRPSFPVIHLAVGLVVAINNRERVGEKRTGYGNLIADPPFIQDVLTETLYAEKMIKNNDLPIDSQGLISIRLVGTD